MSATGIAQFPRVMVKVNCSRCHHRVGELWASQNGSGPYGMGQWHPLAERKCKCTPPVELPEGEELAELLRRARKRRAAGKGSVTIRR